jgi:predicted CopG family antitoxin
VRFARWSDCNEWKTRLAATVVYVYNTYMTKKLTITVSDEVYEGLHRRIGRRKISRFIDDLARKHVIDRHRADYWLTASKPELRRAYAEEAVYEATRETEFKQQDERWLDGLIGDVLRADDETR